MKLLITPAVLAVALASGWAYGNQGAKTSGTPAETTQTGATVGDNDRSDDMTEDSTVPTAGSQNAQTPGAQGQPASGTNTVRYVCQEKVTDVTTTNTGKTGEAPKRLQATTETECMRLGGNWVEDKAQEKGK